MTPELPFELPSGVILNELRFEALHCSMVRMGSRCGNSAGTMILYPSVLGSYGAIALCDMCVGQLPDKWIPSLEARVAER